MTARSSFSFWQPKRAPPVLDPSTRCRPRRIRTSAILHPPPITVNFQVKTFKLYGSLRRANTEVHNSLPSLDTIQTEKTLLSFEEKRKTEPDSAEYYDFYRSLASSITPLPSRHGTARSWAGPGSLDGPKSRAGGAVSLRSVDSRNSFFTVEPTVASSWYRPLQTRESLNSRLNSSHGTLRPATVYRNSTAARSTLSVPKLNNVALEGEETETARDQSSPLPSASGSFFSDNFALSSRPASREGAIGKMPSLREDSVRASTSLRSSPNGIEGHGRQTGPRSRPPSRDGPRASTTQEDPGRYHVRDDNEGSKNHQHAHSNGDDDDDVDTDTNGLMLAPPSPVKDQSPTSPMF